MYYFFSSERRRRRRRRKEGLWQLFFFLRPRVELLRDPEQKKKNKIITAQLSFSRLLLYIMYNLEIWRPRIYIYIYIHNVRFIHVYNVSLERKNELQFPTFISFFFSFLRSAVIGHALGLSVPTTKDKTKQQQKKLNKCNVHIFGGAGGYKHSVVPNKFQLTSPMLQVRSMFFVSLLLFLFYMHTHNV